MDVLVVRAQSLKSGEFTVSYTMTVGWQIKSVSSCTESTEMSRRKEVFQKCAVYPQGSRFCLHQAVAELPSPVSATCPSFSTSASAGSSSLPCGRSVTTPPQRPNWDSDSMILAPYSDFIGFSSALLVLRLNNYLSDGRASTSTKEGGDGIFL